jgi:hypothetical protein
MIHANFVMSAARHDHDGAHDQRAEDAPEQHLVLIQRWHGEIREQQREDEDVVHAQRFLDEIASEELDRLRRAGVVPHACVEDQRQPDPDERPDERFLQRRDVGLAMKHAQVQREHREDEHVEPDPKPD